ncbi:MAG: FAD-dependent monooxygenase [Pararhodobacter sp.]
MPRIIIAGAGIGGLSAALCLHNFGFEVKVFESVSQMRPLGVGINVMSSAAKILRDLGLTEALDAIAIHTRCIEYRTRFGHLIQSDPRNVEAGFPAPQYSIHRGEFQLLLLDALRARAGDAAVETGRPVTGYRQDADGAEVLFADGSFERADLVIGAEGLRSPVRAQMHPGDGPLNYEGTMMFRGAVEMPVIGDGRTMVIAGDHDCKFVTYPISEKLRLEGRALTNWVAEIRHSAPRPIAEADWRQGTSMDYITPFRGFQMPDMDIAAILEATQSVTEFPMIDRDPLPFWTDGRVTLLGDAAHPMYPIGANGASQAVLDARALADALAAQPGPEGLKAYEAARLPIATNVVRANRLGGPEQVLDIAAARVKGPDDRIEDLITPAELEEVAANYRRIAGFNKAPAVTP